RIFPKTALVLVIVLISSFITAAAPLPVTTFELMSGLPEIMNVGETYTVVVQVESDQRYGSIQAMPSFMFPGKGVVAIQGGDRAGSGTSATLEITYKAKSSTANFPGGGFAPVHAVIGVRYGGGYVAVQDYLFNVTVP
nr:hypothetical protein [Chloroflexota bacterium]